jgi:hypothetical protein
MNKKGAGLISAGLSIIFFLLFCQASGAIPVENKRQGIDTNITSIKFKVTPAPDWTALFYRQHGWLGADGIFSIPFNGIDKQVSAAAKTLLIFSDTMVGDIADGKLINNYGGAHSSIATLTGRDPAQAHIKFDWKKDAKGMPGSFFSPQTAQSKPNDFFWLGDGFTDPEMAGKTYIFAYRINVTGTGAWDFATVGTVMIILPKGSKPPFNDQQQKDAPLYLAPTAAEGLASFGSGILQNTARARAPHPDGYIYVYGTMGKHKKVLVARVLPQNIEKFDTWRFWDGKGWNADIKNSAPIADRASDELSVTPLADGKYLMVFETDGIGPTVGMRLGRSPYGPFGPIIKVWDCKNDLPTKSSYAYNAKAHPALSKPGELLISYNVNTFDWKDDLNLYPNLYHPRFIRLKLLK